ncbi:hypothetical protein C815_00322 [Firmicutes bacterium M10-2]|nr:hypothetical protein C815_00322 [Firmicutes bacterium M10-2]
MLNNMKIKCGPEYYMYDQGAIEREVPALLEENQAKKVLIVHGTKSWEVAKPFLTFLNDPNYEFIYHKYSGECSYQEAANIDQIIKDNNIDFVIGVGGGKLCDLVGVTGHFSNIKYGVIPTLASNCAPWTPLSVMYKENGESEGKSEHYKRQACFLITDPYLVIQSPVEYFIAGLADTLAKWYESVAILEQEELQDEPFLKMAKAATEVCRDAILKDGTKAIEDMKNQQMSDEFIRLSEIIIAVAGLVGGLGDKYARNAAAHALHDGMSKYIPESHRYLHGEKVAYGILYQLALEDKWEEIDALMPMYKQLNLPLSMHQMDLYPKDEATIDEIVAFMDGKEKVHLIPIEINQPILKDKLMKLEDYMVQYQ